MKFSEYKYERPDLSGFKVRFQTTLDSFKKAATAEEQAELVQSINNLRVEFDSMGSICSIRHSVNTNDKFYEDENHFYDEHYPEISELINSYYRALLLSPFTANSCLFWLN
jgi:oligoendopeptidase F